MTGHKLYIKLKNGDFEPIDGLIHSPSLKPLKRKSIKDAFKKYIELCTRQKCKKNQNSEILYFNKLESFLDEKEVEFIDEVTRDHMDQFENLLLKKTKPSSVNRRFHSINHFFVKCVEWNFINISPCKGKKFLKEEANPKKPWTDDVFDKFITTCDGIYEKVFRFLWMTGCRPMELKNLKWTDIDYDEKTIKFRCGKNAQTVRFFPLTEQVDKLLHSLKPTALHVFVDGKNQINNDNLYHYAKHRLRPLNLNAYTVYGIRHGFGTKLAKSGVSAFYIAELMGHVKIQTTKKYIHSDKNILNDILNNARC